MGVLVALSLALHVGLLAWLAWWKTPAFFAGAPDPSLMSVELVSPEAAASSVASRPSRARPRLARAATVPSMATAVVEPSPLAPYVPPAPASPGGGQAADVPSANLRAALQAGGGCAREGLSREAREACAEKLGRLQPGAPAYAAPMDPAKRAYYDAVVAAGPSGRGYGDPKPGGAQPDGDYFRVLNCSIKFGPGAKAKDRQGEVRLGRTPCSVPVQGSFFTPEASVRKR